MDTIKSIERLVQSEQWGQCIGKTVTREDLELMIHQVLGFKNWSTWGNYIGYWQKKIVDGKFSDTEYEFHDGYLLMNFLGIMKQNEPFTRDNETFTILGRGRFKCP